MTVVGTIGATAVNESYTRAGSRGYYSSAFFELTFGDEGRVYVRSNGPIVEDQTAQVTALLELPANDTRGVTFVCAGAGSTLLVYDSGPVRWEAHLSSLSQLGSCSGGTPVAGEVSVALHPDGGGPALMTSTLQGAAFTAPIGYRSKTWTPSTVFFEAASATPWGFVYASFGEAPTSALLHEGAYFIVPGGEPDAGAVYCVGPGSTATITGSGPALEIESMSLKNLTRLGACPTAPVEGGLDLCSGLPFGLRTPC